MNYYLVNQSFGPLYIDIANACADAGLDTTLITGQLHKVQVELDSRINKVILNRYNRNSILKRLFTWLLFTFLLSFYILKSKRKSVWLISTNPPFAPWLSFLLKMKKSKVILLVYDIYPEALTTARILTEKHIIYRFWNSITQKTYKLADHIISIGDTMSGYLAKQNGKLKEKITTIPNWNVIRYSELENDRNRYREQRQAVGKIHIVYSGNLGAAHDFTTILETAKLLQADNRFVFSIVGEGFHKNAIREFIDGNDLNNIQWETFKHEREVPEVFRSADIALVTLGAGGEKSSIPSKTYDALAAGSAILVIAPPGSEMEKLIEEGGVGICVNPGNIQKVENWLVQLANNNDLLKEHKLASEKLAKKYSPDNVNKYVQVMTTV
jgi:glycosyltransferase involved in cell wall biosynthesis